MSATAIVITGRGTVSPRWVIPPPMKPGSVGIPWSPTGPVETMS